MEPYEIIEAVLYTTFPLLLIFLSFLWHKVLNHFKIRPLDQLLAGEKHIMTERASKFWFIFNLCLCCGVHFIFMIIWFFDEHFLIFYVMTCIPIYILITIPNTIDAYLRSFLIITDRRVVAMGLNCSVKLNAIKKTRATNSSLDIPLDKIDSMFVEMGFFSKITGTGKITINSGSQTYSFYGFQMPERFKNTVMEQVDLKKKEAAELQMQQQAELAQEQRADAERMAQMQANAMAKAMLEAQGIAVPPQQQYQMPQNPHGQFQMPQNPPPQMPMMEIPVGGGVQIPVTPTQMQQQSQFPPQQSQFPPQQSQFPPQQSQIPPQQTEFPPQQVQIPPQAEPSQYVGQRQLPMVQCLSCQNQLNPDAKFCPACGAPQ